MDEGDRRNGRTGGLVGTGLIQIDFETGHRTAAPGFSGTPVWDATEKSVCGMVVNINSRDGETSAYVIPSATLVKAYPALAPLSRPPNPYRGLEAFMEKDAAFFFGRETVVGELVEMFRTQPLVPVIGASGSGKSSLVFAGLIAELLKSGNWAVVYFRPKDAPFYNLSLAMIPLLYKDKLEQIRKAKELSKDFRNAETDLADVARTIEREHPEKQLLVVADQFEELFTSNPDASIRRRFMDLLMEPLSSGPFALLLAMRADFTNQAVGYGLLAQALDQYKPKILSGMNEEELTSAVERMERSLEAHDFNSQRLYALHAMANFDPERMESKRVVASGAFIDQPDYPILFSSPDCSHHDDGVGTISFSPDGRTLASRFSDGAVRLRDVSSYFNLKLDDQVFSADWTEATVIPGAAQRRPGIQELPRSAWI